MDPDFVRNRLKDLADDQLMVEVFLSAGEYTPEALAALRG